MVETARFSLVNMFNVSTRTSTNFRIVLVATSIALSIKDFAATVAY